MLGGIILIAVAYNVFLYPTKIISGSVAGIATILTEFIPIKAGYIIFILNVPILVWSFKKFGYISLIKTGIAGTLLPGFIIISDRLPELYFGMLPNSIIGGIITGIGVSSLYFINASTGGTAAIAQIIQSKTNVNKGNILLILDGLIVLSGLFTYPSSKIMYSSICVLSLTATINGIQTLTKKYNISSPQKN